MSCATLARWISVSALLIFLCIQTGHASGWIRISPIEGSVGDSVRISGGGFGPDSNVGIFFEEKIVAIAKTDLNGVFSVRLDVPEISCGIKTVKVVDEVRRNAYTTFNLTPKITRLSSREAPAGSSITVTGKGFSANSDVEVILANFFDVSGIVLKEVLAKKIARTNEKGTFETNFEIPYIASGYYIIYANDPVCGLESNYIYFNVLEAKSKSTPTPAATSTPNVTSSQEKEVANMTKPTESPPKKTVETSTKVQRSTPGFEFLLAVGGIALAYLILIDRDRKWKS